VNCRKTGVFRDRNERENAQLYLSGAMGKKPQKPIDFRKQQLKMSSERLNGSRHYHSPRYESAFRIDQFPEPKED